MHRVSRFTNSLRISRPRLGLFILLMGLLAPLLIAACGGDDPTAVPQATATNTPQAPPATATQPPPAPTNTPVQTTPTADTAEAGQSLTIALGELNGSGQSGWATLTNRGAQTEVVLSATAGISELNHIHAGSCTDLGGVVHPLTSMGGGCLGVYRLRGNLKGCSNCVAGCQQRRHSV